MRSVVNELWHDGAEAISVNDVRLTPTTAIRFAGEAVLVDFQPITSPYTIRAIGDRHVLETGFVDSAVASRYQTLAGARRDRVLVRPSATSSRCRRARPSHPATRNQRPRRQQPRDLAGDRRARAGRRHRPRAGPAPTVPDWLEPYLPIAVVAALDAVFGGIRARLDGIFDAKVFVVSFVSNVLVAALIVFLGDKLGVGGQLSTAVVVVLGIRIFGNAAAIRRHLFRA